MVLVSCPGPEEANLNLSPDCKARLAQKYTYRTTWFCLGKSKLEPADSHLVRCPQSFMVKSKSEDSQLPFYQTVTLWTQPMCTHTDGCKSIWYPFRPLQLLLQRCRGGLLALGHSHLPKVNGYPGYLKASQVDLDACDQVADSHSLHINHTISGAQFCLQKLPPPWSTCHVHGLIPTAGGNIKLCCTYRYPNGVPGTVSCLLEDMGPSLGDLKGSLTAGLSIFFKFLYSAEAEYKILWGWLTCSPSNISPPPPVVYTLFK